MITAHETARLQARAAELAARYRHMLVDGPPITIGLHRSGWSATAWLAGGRAASIGAHNLDTPDTALDQLADKLAAAAEPARSAVEPAASRAFEMWPAGVVL